MLRLREVRSVRGEIDVESGEAGPETLAVTFEGDAGDFATAQITLHMNERPNDAQLLSDAQRLLSQAIAHLHQEHPEPS